MRTSRAFDGSCQSRGESGAGLGSWVQQQPSALELARYGGTAFLVANEANQPALQKQRILAAGCDGYIAKPLAYKEFLATISALLLKTRLKTPLYG